MCVCVCVCVCEGGSGSSCACVSNRVEFKAKKLIKCSLLSNFLEPLYLSRDFGTQSRSTRNAMHSHQFCVNIANSVLVIFCSHISLNFNFEFLLIFFTFINVEFK